VGVPAVMWLQELKLNVSALADGMSTKAAPITKTAAIFRRTGISSLGVLRRNFHFDFPADRHCKFKSHAFLRLGIGGTALALP
jgi:hypothetical protein